ncbi:MULTISPECIES: phosphopantetheine-binding protein [Streptomyces]|uniref:Phosphopantetheine-binding protein n=2 Tax=Streptomyces TaxID=1883 RepID=A0ABV9IW22_9ACTN
MNGETLELEKALIIWVEEWTADAAQVAVDAETNLSHTGVLDSMAVVGLIAHLEEQADVSFDFATYDPADGVTIRGLVRHCLG